MTRYRVIAPLVNCKTMTRDGTRFVHLQQGAFVPEDAPEDWIGYHLRDGLIAEIPDDAPPAAPPLPEEPPAEEPKAEPPEEPPAEPEAKAEPKPPNVGQRRRGG